MEQNKNLDELCAKYGWDIANETKDETLINKSLGVLQEQGIYAFFLFLESRGSSDKKNAEKTGKHCWNMLEDIVDSMKGVIWDKNTWSETLRVNILSDINNLSLSLQMVEQTLIYARYHAKALKEK